MKYAKIAWTGSLALMLGVFYFQYIRGLQPCQLCIYQRIPHIIALVFGGYGILARKYWPFPTLGAVILMGAGIAFFHVGVEQHWWEGLQSCSGDAGINLDDLLATPPARCDEIAWSFLGLSMATWNGLISLVLGTLWFMAWKRPQN